MLSEVERHLDGNPKFNKSYDDFFRIITNNAQGFGPPAPRLNDDAALHAEDAAFVGRTLGVVMIAEDIDAMGAVAQYLETQYLRMGNRLWELIQKRPDIWVNVATRSVLFPPPSTVHLPPLHSLSSFFLEFMLTLYTSTDSSPPSCFGRPSFILLDKLTLASLMSVSRTLMARERFSRKSRRWFRRRSSN